MCPQKCLSGGSRQNKSLMKGLFTKVWPELKNQHRMVRPPGTRTRTKGPGEETGQSLRAGGEGEGPLTEANGCQNTVKQEQGSPDGVGWSSE